MWRRTAVHVQTDKSESQGTVAVLTEKAALAGQGLYVLFIHAIVKPKPKPFLGYYSEIICQFVSHTQHVIGWLCVSANVSDRPQRFSVSQKKNN